LEGEIRVDAISPDASMFDFRTPPTSAPRSTPLWPRILPLFTLLILVLAMMMYLSQRAGQWADAPEPAAALPPAPGEQPGTQPEELFTAVDHERLAGFVDHARGGDVDRDSFFYLLKLARDNPPDAVRRHARQDLTLGLLLDHPGRHRGVIVQARGRLRRLIQYPAPENDAGIAVLYEGWMYTSDGGQFPYTLIFATPPADIPTGAAIHVPVEVVGYFLGWWRFTTAEGKPSSAPYIMVSSIRRLDATLPASKLELPIVWVAIAAGVVVVAVFVIMGVFAFRSLRSTPSQLSVDPDAVTFRPVEPEIASSDPSAPHSNGQADYPQTSESSDVNP
jgi:hypothetical protein